MTRLELLAPARDLECGMAAIDHGADAVYVGAERFGARLAAANSIEDVEQLCSYARRYGAKVYAAVNTIVYDSELDDMQSMVARLEKAGVSAVLVQDMAVAQAVAETHMSLHASTQADCRTPSRVEWLARQGFSRAVLARELSIGEVAKIHRQVPQIELEVFVHGALCVSYSGQCYASQRCFGRSANRGECAQFCRLRFNLLDADGKLVEQNRHLLSLKDLCLLDHLEELAEAGATSFKIEGRLKDASYVKNVVAAYSQQLDDIVARHPERYARASHGKVHYAFMPDVRKTFNRGYTTYFAHGRQCNMAQMATPKAMGSAVGKVTGISRSHIDFHPLTPVANGDGLCFINNDGQLVGFRVNRAEGQRLMPLRMPLGLTVGTMLWRNSDTAFEKLLAHNSAKRKISLAMTFSPNAMGFVLSATTADGRQAQTVMAMPHGQANKPQRDNIAKQLSKLGGTVYECTEVNVPNAFDLFVPSSALAAMRRKVVEILDRGPVATPSPTKERHTENDVAQSCPSISLGGCQGNGALLNISNNAARQFYTERGVVNPSPAYELQPRKDIPLMQCRYCLRYEMGYCQHHGGVKPTWREPLILALPDGRRFTLKFNCKQCQMEVYER